MAFPADFVWGAAAASYQIEGAILQDGKGPSIWDEFCKRENVIWNNQSGVDACDHYHRCPEDVALMKEMGLHAYRLSVSWPRLIPDGIGPVNPKGLAFYDRLVDELLTAGITPFVTLFHWDYPYSLYCRGGWLNPDSSDWFAEYARTVVDRLSDRVRYWITLNEPQSFVWLGHYLGRHAPGDKLSMAQALQVGHHSLLAHGKSVQAIRSAAKTSPQVGLAPTGMVRIPASPNVDDIEAARQSMFAVENQADYFSNAWFSDPIFFKQYPADGLKIYGRDVPLVKSGDMEIIGQPLDFYGVTIYLGRLVKAGADGSPENVPFPVGYDQTAIRWYVAPEALYWGPRFFYERYRLPIFIFENGMSNVDWISLDGCIHDPQRIDFMQRYLLALETAIEERVDVRGYFYWSVMDNFEWAEGYKERFGLIYVDYPTQRRVFKDSAHWYRQIIASNGASLDPKN